MLKIADLKPFYTTGEDDEPSGFLYECLTNSQRFDLGLGYFRSTGFSCLALGFASFLQGEGSMRFIINDSLVQKDKMAILQGQQEQPDDVYEQELLRDLEMLTKTLTKRNKHFFSCLSWLISSGRLQMIAVVPKKNKVGIVHHKFGIFTDETGNQAAFNGSVNFSQYALQYNVESIWCEYSWEANGIARKRIDEMIRLFENTWNGTSQAVRTIPLERVKTVIHNKFPKKPIKELVEMECELAKEVIEHPGTSDAYKKKLEILIHRLQANGGKVKDQNVDPNNKWKHQDEAVAIFMEKERGVLDMATGTGKTRTALTICKNLINKNKIETIIISCDGNDLLGQWYKELITLITQEYSGWIILKNFEPHHQTEKFRINSIKKVLIISRPQLHLAISGLSEGVASKTLLVHDEVHRLGSVGNRERLSGLADSIRYRLGLSATPERVYDAEGTQFIMDHIGPIIYNFTLEDGIRKGILSPFNYFPVSYQLTTSDRGRIKDMHKRKAASEKAGKPMSDEDFWNGLARVYKTAEGKFAAFRNFITHHPDILERCIVFVETMEYGKEILDIIHQHHTDFHSYFGGEDHSLLKRFANGEIKCLLTCHRLSEGIDIRSLQNVILISSAKTRLETIQRIGRCLRTDPENPVKIANVVDFIREGNENDIILNTDQEREAFLSQLSRIRPEKITHYARQ
jgi:superfamily II DNA or RNA helicase